MKITHFPIFTIKLLVLLFLLPACRSDARQLEVVQTIAVNSNFQTQLSPMPTVPPHRCGAWTSDNTPGAYSTITIYAKLTKNVTGVPGIPATAVIHFKNADTTLDQQPVSDGNGYVSFTLSLQGRQPHLTPATVDVKFATPDSSVQCSGFFTPL